jgi:RNA polymerase sigma-70 factor (ECF subfamily)
MPSTLDFYVPLEAPLLRRAQRGERAAFELIYRRYRRPAFNLALRVLGEPAAAEDVVQEVFVRLFDSIKGYRAEAPFGAWLRRLVANATLDELRRRRWLDDRVDVNATAQMTLPAGRPEAQAEAWALLMRLPPKARAVVVLHEVEGYTHKELAEWFGLSESYSKSVLSRALKRLNRIVPEHEKEDQVYAGS